MAMADLADTFVCLKNFAEAETLERKLLEKRKAILGLDHPDTLRTDTRLATLSLRHITP